MSWFNRMFKEDSDVSSKRFSGVSLLLWGMLVGSIYIVYTLWKNLETDPNIFSFLEFCVATGAAILTGGTLSERVMSKYSRKPSENKPKENEPKEDVK